MSNLARIPFLKDIPLRTLRAAEKEAVWFSVPGGGTLFDEGTSSDAIYFVLSGTLGAFRRAPDGRTDFVGHIRPGEPVGEMAMLDRKQRIAAATAGTDCKLLVLSVEQFDGPSKLEPNLSQT